MRFFHTTVLIILLNLLFSINSIGQPDTLMIIEGQSINGLNIGALSTNSHSGFRAEINYIGFWAEDNDRDGLYSYQNGGDGVQSSYNSNSGYKANNNEEDGFYAFLNNGYAGQFTSPNSRLDAAVRIAHTHPDRVDLELGGHGRVTADDSYVLYLNYNNGAIGNESFQLRNGTNNSNAFIVYENGNATFAGAVTATNIMNSSDRRYKKNIIPLSNSLSNISLINGVKYNWDQERWPNRTFGEEIQIGFVAQELEKVYPELVHTDEEGYKSVAYNKMTAVLVESVKELNAKLTKENESLRIENKMIKKELERIDNLEERLAYLEYRNKE